MDHRLHIAPGFIDLAVNVAFAVQPRRIGGDGLAVEADLDDVGAGDERGRHGARHKEMLRVLSGAGADVAEAVQNAFVRQHMTGGDEIRDAGFVAVGRIALRVTGRGQQGAANSSVTHATVVSFTVMALSRLEVQRSHETSEAYLSSRRRGVGIRMASGVCK